MKPKEIVIGVLGGLAFVAVALVMMFVLRELLISIDSMVPR